MKLTPLRKYAISGPHFPDDSITASNPEEAVRLLYADAEPPIGTKLVIDGLNYRIDSDPSPVPVATQGWTKGKPPKDGNYYVVLGFDDGPCVVSGHPNDGPDDDYSTPGGSDASPKFITHYLPLPKES